MGHGVGLFWVMSDMGQELYIEWNNKGFSILRSLFFGGRSLLNVAKKILEVEPLICRTANL